jgi:hypothetical protein
MVALRNEDKESFMTCFKRLALGAASLVYSSFAYAGWSSGGGELIKFQRNPWWSGDAKEQVSYCIDMKSEAQFGLPFERARVKIQLAFAFWRQELTKTGFKVRTPEFIESSCSESTRLRFQLGSLNLTQLKLLPFPEQYVGQAVLTQYDEKNLLGSGFIYIAPQAGPNGLRRETLNDDDAWTKFNGEILQAVLQHEIGHTFGIGHAEASDTTNLMHEWFPTLAVSKLYARHFSEGVSKKFAVVGMNATEEFKHKEQMCWHEVPQMQFKNEVKVLAPELDRPFLGFLKTRFHLAGGRAGSCLRSEETKNKFTVYFSPRDSMDDTPPEQSYKEVVSFDLIEQAQVYKPLASKVRRGQYSYEVQYMINSVTKIKTGFRDGLNLRVQSKPTSDTAGSAVEMLDENGNIFSVTSGYDGFGLELPGARY